MIYRVLQAKLETMTALHVGSGRRNGLTDAPVRRDAQGRLIIPGTAIAGSLRTTATRLAPRLKLGGMDGRHICLALLPRDQNRISDEMEEQKRRVAGSSRPCGCPVCHLFGDLRPGVNDPEFRESGPRWVYDAPDLTHASRVRVYDAIIDEDSLDVLVRDAVGIDRRAGAAARAGAVKFDLEVIPPGTAFDLRIELDESATEQDENLLVAALAEWEAGRGYLGGRSARGLGRIQARKVKADDSGAFQCAIRDLTTQEGLMAFLRSPNLSAHRADKGEWFMARVDAARGTIVSLNEQDRRLAPQIASCWIDVEMTLVGDGPVLAHDTTIAALSGFDHAPLLAQLPTRDGLDKDWRPEPVLTGSSLRGVIRSRAEKIARTLWTENYRRDTDAQILMTCPACNPVESRRASRKERDSNLPPSVPLTSCDTLLREGRAGLADDAEATDEHLCLACRLFGSARRGSRLRVDDALLAETLPETWWKAQDFLAIDRFLGGGLENAKFDALPLMNPKFRFHLRVENPREWELGWLALTLRDLYDGLLRVGFGAAKGYGRVRGENIIVRVGYLAATDFPALVSVPPRQVSTSGLYTIAEFGEANWTGQEVVRRQVDRWVGAFVDEVKQYTRQPDKLDPIPADTFFGKVERWFGGER
jgi:CRISPR/Cas system CSM-associated protein Csm3 (group 7 of RAMP superfamily)